MTPAEAKTELLLRLDVERFGTSWGWGDRLELLAAAGDQAVDDFIESEISEYRRRRERKRARERRAVAREASGS